MYTFCNYKKNVCFCTAKGVEKAQEKMFSFTLSSSDLNSV